VSVVGGLGLLVSRAHHADVGGMWPGSLPAGSTELYQEGVIIPPMRLTDEVMRLLLANMRNPQQRSADLSAQLACHAIGAERLRELAARHGRGVLLRGMAELHDYAERRMRAAIRRLPDGRYQAADVVEEADGGDAEIHAAVRVRGDRITVDFDGTAAQRPGNLNCPLPVTRSAVYYVVRAVCAPELEASGGAFVPVEVRAPEGCLVNARFPAAVVAGNTETSSRIVDVVLAALGQALPVPAMGQGTMNNVVLGNGRFTYYETIGGGQGACPQGDGPDAVHVAMSNTLNTPIEVVEREYPLRVERYGVRRGSGGAGEHRGGDGVVRALRVLEDCRLSVLSERRRHAPRGAAGGEDGAMGENRLNGRRVPGKLSRELKSGDVLEIRTPGGGGYGAAL
jgi:N-methylhydantoinase B